MDAKERLQKIADLSRAIEMQLRQLRELQHSIPPDQEKIKIIADDVTRLDGIRRGLMSQS